MTKRSVAMSFTSGFRRHLLPDAAAYFAKEGFTFIGRGEWRNTKCCFHPDRHPSLRVRLESGSFYCMVCGEKGGDVLAFHQKRHGQTFKEAAIALGAWGRMSTDVTPTGFTLEAYANAKGLPVEELEQWGLKTEGSRVAMPYYLVDGQESGAVRYRHALEG